MDHLLDGGLDELGGVEREGIVETLGKALFQLRQALLHRFGNLQGIGPGLLVDRDQSGGLAVEISAEEIILQTDLGTAHILEPHDRRPFRIGAQDDVLELGRLGETTACDHREGHFHGRRGRRLADRARAELLVLSRHGTLDIARGDAERGHAIGLEPDPHREVRHPEDRRLVRARDTLQRIEHVEIGIARDIALVVAPVRRVAPMINRNVDERFSTLTPVACTECRQERQR